MADGILIEQPKTDRERQAVAELCTTALDLSLPTVLDKIDDWVATAYEAFPDRIYVVGAEGQIAYKGRPGPAGFNVPEARTALEFALAGEITPYGPLPSFRTSGARRRDLGGRGRRPGGALPDMRALDVDEDGQISRPEWQGPASHFDRMDVDGDGYLDSEEISRRPPEGQRRR